MTHRLNTAPLYRTCEYFSTPPFSSLGEVGQARWSHPSLAKEIISPTVSPERVFPRIPWGGCGLLMTIS